MQKGVTDKYNSGSLILKEAKEAGCLLVGDCNSAVDKHIIKPHKVMTVFTFGHDAVPQKKQEGINYKEYNILDNKSQNIIEILDEVYEQVEEARKIGGVLLHCFTGISRSPSFAVAYLMRKKQMSYDHAKSFVKKYRSVIHPNDNFHRQLQKYEKILIKRAEEQRLRKLKSQQSPQTTAQIETILPNISTLSKRGGVKGAVRSAHRSISPQNKSIETKQEKRKQSLGKIYEKQEEGLSKSREKANREKQVKSVYSNKTKIK